ncbi:MAG: hypothetical protein C0518_00410 [Opitutus sp.]|nr:hypothetical protein [Opitutus sp.]
MGNVNENDAYLFDIEQPARWTFDGEPVWISGWFLSKRAAKFSDIRAVIDGVPHLGILGMPRPEVEQQHRGRVGLPHAGFLLRVQPPRRARELRIELLDAGHRWVEIWRTPIKVKQGPAARGEYVPALVPEHLHRLLQTRRASPAANIDALAHALVRESSAIPLNTLPNPPFFGALERPEFIGGTQYGKVRAEGWIIHLEQRIVRLIASTRPDIENELLYGDRPRPEAAQLFPQHPHAAHSQFFGMLDIDETAPGPVNLRMFAELEDGTRHLVFARRFHPRSAFVWERPLPEFSRSEFVRCALALRRATRRLGVSIDGTVAEQWAAVRSAWALYRRTAPEEAAAAERQPDEYETWRRTNGISPRLSKILLAKAERLKFRGPTFCVLVDTQDCDPAKVARLAASLTAQIYPNWKARFVGPVALTSGERRCAHHHASGIDVVASLNAAAEQSDATWIMLLPGDARLSHDALLEIAERIAEEPHLELVYTDEDRMDDTGQRSSPDFKPDWSPALALSGLFPGLLALIRREKFVSLGGLRPAFDAVSWYDLLLRLGDDLPGSRVAHVPLVCYHASASMPRELELSHRAYEQGRAALAETMRRRGWAAAPFLPEAGHFRRTRFHQLRWDADGLAKSPVTIVIPTRDRLHLLQECIEQLEETVDWRYVKLVIVDDHSRDVDARRYLERIQERSDLRCRVVRLDDPHAPFNYSRLVNAALPYIDTPLVLHLNNDVNALEPGWLEEMVGWFAQPDIGVVGAKLVYPDRSLNHTGIVIGPHGGLADTPWAKQNEGDVALAWHAAAREVSAVTGACLLTRTALYRELNGFDEGDFAVAYNDVDYCLQVRAAGKRVLYTPQAKLMHWGSATRGVTFDDAEHIAWLRRYRGYSDPFFSRHWRLEKSAVRCRPESGSRAARAPALRVLLVTHNLNLEGAPLFLLEYAAHLARQPGFRVAVLASQNGPLRESFLALGATVQVEGTQALFAAADETAFQQNLRELGQRIDWTAVDLVVGNTLLSFWSVLLAREAGRASLLYIHESASVFRQFEPRLALALHRHVHDALRSATRALFLCRATRDYYADDDRGNFREVPSWIDADAIEKYREQNPRTEVRRRLGLREDETVIANIGTVCERKGQHDFIRAIEQFNRGQHPGHPVRFLLVGAREGIYLDLLRRDLARLQLTNVSLVAETREVFDYFAASDLFVCTSYEESFPRVVMEAMAFRVPIVSTDVHGISELIGQRQDGYLFPPGDAEALSRLMLTCLAKERSGKSLAPTAYSKIRRFHDAREILPRHVNLAREAWLAHPEK